MTAMSVNESNRQPSRKPSGASQSPWSGTVNRPPVLVAIPVSEEPRRRSRLVLFSALAFVVGIAGGAYLIARGGSSGPQTAAGDVVAPVVPAAVATKPKVLQASQEKRVPAAAAVPIPVKDSELTPEQVFAQCSPSVVTVIAKNSAGKQVSQGTGFVVDRSALHFTPEELAYHKGLCDFVFKGKPSAFVVTNFHVIEAAVDAEVVLSDGTTAHVISIDRESPRSDLAVLLFPYEAKSPLKPLALEKSPPNVGSPVYAIGSPRGLEATLSHGLVSSVRTVEDQKVVQTTAAISPGSSGGPLLDSRGHVVGVVRYLLRGGQSLNFAVAGSDVLEFLGSKRNERSVHVGRDAYQEWRTTVNGFRSVWFDQLSNLPAGTAKNRLGSTLREMTTINEELTREPVDASALLKRLIAVEADAPASAAAWVAYLKGSLLWRAILENLKGTRSEVRSSDEYRSLIATFREGLRLSPDSDVFRLRLCAAYSFLGEDAALRSLAEELVRRRPYDCDSHYYLGSALAAVDDRSGAIAELKRAVELDPHRAFRWHTLGNYQLSAEDWEAAVASYEKSETLGVPKEIAALGLGRAHEGAKRYERAISYFQIAALDDDGISHEQAIRGIQRCRAALGR